MCKVMQRVVFVLNTTNQVRCKMNIKMVTKHQIEDPWYHLTGWYEVEMGAGLVDVYGKSLED